jgi:hypothetical protein
LKFISKKRMEDFMSKRLVNGSVLAVVAGLLIFGACDKKADAAGGDGSVAASTQVNPADVTGEIRVFAFAYPPEKIAREKQAEVFRRQL